MTERRHKEPLSDYLVREQRGRLVIEDTIKRLIAGEHLVGNPASEADIERAEKQLGVPLPPDYRLFLRAAGGAARGPQWRGLFRLPEFVSLNQRMPIFRTFRGVFGVANEGFIVLALDYRRGPQPIVVSLGLSTSYEEDILKEADSFTEWLESTLD